MSASLDIKIVQLTNQQAGLLAELIRIFEREFELTDLQIPDPIHLEKVLTQKKFLALVAIKDGKVVGGLTAHLLSQYYTTKSVAYLYDLAVDKSFQRQGIGKQLLHSLSQFCSTNGIDGFFVQAEKIDTHAVDFYRAAQPEEELDVFQFEYRSTN